MSLQEHGGNLYWNANGNLVKMTDAQNTYPLRDMKGVDTTLNPQPPREVIDYCLWIDQRYSHRFLGLGPTAWDNALVELDAKASGIEYPTTIEVDKTAHEPRKYLPVKQSHLVYYDEYTLTRLVDGDNDEFEVRWDVEEDPWEEIQPGRRVTRAEMEEEKRRERNRVARRRKEAALYKPIAQQSWLWREGAPRSRNSTLTSFDAIMKETYSEASIAQLASISNPMYANAIVAAIDTANGTITIGHDLGFQPPAQVTAFGGMKVVASPHVPKDRAYLIPANIANYLPVAPDE